MGETVELDLREIFKVFLKRAWIIVLCAVIVGASVVVYTVNFVAPQYQASVSFYVNNNSSQDTSYITSADLAVALRLVSTYVNIIKSDRVLDKVVEEIGMDLTAAQIRGLISAEVMGETEMFEVTVTTPNPQLSADIANSIAAVAPDEIAAIIEGSSAKIIDYARVPNVQSSPNYTTNTIIGAFVGAVLALVVIVIQYMMDTRIKGEEDLAKICTLSVLGMIPDIQSDDKVTVKKVRR